MPPQLYSYPRLTFCVSVHKPLESTADSRFWIKPMNTLAASKFYAKVSVSVVRINTDLPEELRGVPSVTVLPVRSDVAKLQSFYLSC